MTGPVKIKRPRFPQHVIKVIKIDDDVFDLFAGEIPLSGIVREVTIIDNVAEYRFTIGGPLNSETRPNPSMLSKAEPYLVWFSNGERAIASHDKLTDILNICNQDSDDIGD